jgi:folate-binding protein YgfZ
VPAWPQEISPEHNPHEAALAPFIDWKKGCYVGQEVVARLDTYKKVQRRLVRLALSRAPEGETALFAGGEEAGRVSSVAVLPGAPFVAALAYVKEAAAALPHFEARDSAGVFSADLHRG